MERECPVCFEDLGARLEVRTPCGHGVCLGCAVRLPPPQRCPLCRADLAALFPPTPRPVPPGHPPGQTSAMARVLAEVVAAEERRAVPRTTTLVLRRAPSLRGTALPAEEPA